MMAAKATLSVQTSWPASTENAETLATVALGLNAQSRTTDPSADVLLASKETHKSAVSKVAATQIQNVHLTRLATNVNASTLAT